MRSPTDRAMVAAVMAAVAVSSVGVLAACGSGADAGRAGIEDRRPTVDAIAQTRLPDVGHRERTRIQKALAEGKTVIASSWGFRPRSLGELAREAAVAVEAEVTAIAPGPPLPDASAYHDAQSGMPTQRISFTAAAKVYGEIGDEFVLFKKGSPSVLLEGDPEYRVNERYLLFVEPRVDGTGRPEAKTFVPVSPDGRLRLEGATVRPVIEGRLGEQLDGNEAMSVEKAAKAAKEGRKG